MRVGHRHHGVDFDSRVAAVIGQRFGKTPRPRLGDNVGDEDAIPKTECDVTFTIRPPRSASWGHAARANRTDAPRLMSTMRSKSAAAVSGTGPSAGARIIDHHI